MELSRTVSVKDSARFVVIVRLVLERISNHNDRSSSESNKTPSFSGEFPLQAAAVAVNQELVLLYRRIGTEILTRQKEDLWGTRVIGRLAKDLRSAFPDVQGLSSGFMQALRKLGPTRQFCSKLLQNCPGSATASCWA